MHAGVAVGYMSESLPVFMSESLPESLPSRRRAAVELQFDIQSSCECNDAELQLCACCAPDRGAHTATPHLSPTTPRARQVRNLWICTELTLQQHSS